MMRPGTTLFDRAALLPIFCGAAYALSMVLAHDGHPRQRRRPRLLGKHRLSALRRRPVAVFWQRRPHRGRPPFPRLPDPRLGHPQPAGYPPYDGLRRHRRHRPDAADASLGHGPIRRGRAVRVHLFLLGHPVGLAGLSHPARRTLLARHHGDRGVRPLRPAPRRGSRGAAKPALPQPSAPLPVPTQSAAAQPPPQWAGTRRPPPPNPDRRSGVPHSTQDAG